MSNPAAAAQLMSDKRLSQQPAGGGGTRLSLDVVGEKIEKLFISLLTTETQLSALHAGTQLFHSNLGVSPQD